jgi:hypothetical protein
MEILWHSGGRHHWSKDSEDWLFIRRSYDSTISSVQLQEGTHHYFKALYKFDDNDQIRLERYLDGPGHFDLTSDLLADGCVLIHTQFFAFAIPPFRGAENVSEITCGEINHSTSPCEPILMRIHGQPNEQPPPFTPDVFRALKDLQSRTSSLVVELIINQNSSDRSAFLMASPALYDTKVYLITEENLHRSIQPGNTIPFSLFDPAIPQVTIKANQYSPASALPDTEWFIAIPVLATSDDQGIVGFPLMIRPMISNFRVEPIGNRVDALWTWRGPISLRQVNLEWDFYVDTHWANTPGELLISWPKFAANRCVNLFERGPCRGWNVEVTATPMLFDRPQKSISTTASL